MRRRLTTWEACKYTVAVVAVFIVSCSIVGAVLWVFPQLAWTLVVALILFVIRELLSLLPR